ncbi:MAG: hypothetical protein U9O24_02475 [Campylobacterota bacterium]|nr:hypothetical protein [Campylobacterota bacterium]
MFNTLIDILQNLSETMALASSHGEAEASLPSFERTLIIFYYDTSR